jgi:hypothetical protein
MATFNINLTDGICRTCNNKTYIGEGGRCLRCVAIALKKEAEAKHGRL